MLAPNHSYPTDNLLLNANLRESSVILIVNYRFLPAFIRPSAGYALRNLIYDLRIICDHLRLRKL